MTKKKQKWRGIPTSSVKKHEQIPKTITNRLKQLSFSLPRITDGKRLAGFAGLAGVGAKFALKIPDCSYYVEPFAGSAKVAQELIKRIDVKYSDIVLNDGASFVYEWLLVNFGKYIVTHDDFVTCVKKWDDEDVVFMFDPPWFKNTGYQEIALFDRESPSRYYKEVMSLCTGTPLMNFNTEGYKIKGKFMIASRKENPVCLNSPFKKKKIKSIYPVSGHYPRVLMTSNMDI